jgi:hypothetical protein
VDTWHKTFFEGSAVRLAAGTVVVTCGVVKPLNMGSIMRLCSCFGIPLLRHLHYGGSDAKNQAFWSQPHVLAQIRSTAVGTAPEFACRGPRLTVATGDAPFSRAIRLPAESLQLADQRSDPGSARTSRPTAVVPEPAELQAAVAAVVAAGPAEVTLGLKKVMKAVRAAEPHWRVEAADVRRAIGRTVEPPAAERGEWSPSAGTGGPVHRRSAATSCEAAADEPSSVDKVKFTGLIQNSQVDPAI